MLLLFFGGEMLVNALLSLVGLGPVRFNTFISGVLAIGFVFGAYYTGTFRGAFLTVDRGQTGRLKPTVCGRGWSSGVLCCRRC